jgi:hypothetical protein
MPDWRDRLLGVLTNPSILTVLLLAGLAGVTFELTHPSIFAPGVPSTICLLLGGYGLNLLPIDYAGVALAAFGLGLIVTEAFVPAFGAFVLGGAAAFLIGSLMMFRDPGRRGCVRRRAGGAAARTQATGDEWRRDPAGAMMPFNRGNLAILLVVVVVLFVLGRAVRIMREYQRAVMFTLGRFSGVKVIGGLVDR